MVRVQATMCIQLYTGTHRVLVPGTSYSPVQGLLPRNDWACGYVHNLPYALTGTYHSVWPSSLDLSPVLMVHCFVSTLSCTEPGNQPRATKGATAHSPLLYLCLGICHHWPETPKSESPRTPPLPLPTPHNRPHCGGVLRHPSCPTVSPLLRSPCHPELNTTVFPLTPAAASHPPEADLLKTARAPHSRLLSLPTFRHPTAALEQAPLSAFLPGCGPALNTTADSSGWIWLPCAPLWQRLNCWFCKHLLISL